MDHLLSKEMIELALSVGGNILGPNPDGSWSLEIGRRGSQDNMFIAVSRLGITGTPDPLGTVTPSSRLSLEQAMARLDEVSRQSRNED
jgi:hypothetical protein